MEYIKTLHGFDIETSLGNFVLDISWFYYHEYI